MALVDLVMPKLGESIMEATVLKWLKQPGDTVKQDESVLEIATDKVDSEVPSTAEGVLEELLYKVNDVVPIGAVIAKIRTGGEVVGIAGDRSTSQAHVQPLQVAAETHVHNHQIPQFSERPADIPATNKFYSPLVLNIASSEGVSMTELENIRGTGNEGRVTKKDILQFVEERNKNKSHGMQVAVHQQPQITIGTERKEDQKLTTQLQPPSPQQTYGNNVEIVEMDRARRLISEHMLKSRQASAHVTSFSEADVTNLVMWREKAKKEFEKREGTKITFTPLFLEAVIRCIKKYPLINSSVDGHNIIIKKDINIGMATALPNGNLIVPVIRNADQFNLVGLARQVNTLADNARNNRLKPEDVQGGTFTFTNVGTFGSLMGAPIINQPQVAILAVGIIKKRPVVVETPAGDSIAIRHMMYLSMSYDHRIIDGSLGSTFLSAVGNELENFDANRNF